MPDFSHLSIPELTAELIRECNKAEADRRCVRPVTRERCGCCGQMEDADDMASDGLNGKICHQCHQDFADVDVPEWDPLDKD
jgi:hypothetical protein